MEHVIRKMELVDLPGFIELCKNHADHERSYYHRDGKRELLEKAIFSDGHQLYCFVVEYKSQLIGYFSYTFDFSTWGAKTFMHLDCLYLVPEFRGMKIGEKIFEYLKEIADSQGCLNIQWQTPDFNQSAIRFYQRTGAVGKHKIRFSLDL